VIKEIREETKKFLESNENENTTSVFVGYSKSMIRVMFTAISVFIKKQETSQIKKKLIIQLSHLEIQEKPNPKQQTGRNNKDKS
jgi:hypothetical protein